MEKNFFDQPLITSESVWTIASGQGDDCKTDCLLNYNYFKN